MTNLDNRNNTQNRPLCQERLHGVNPKKEPVFLLQNAIIFRLGNREDVSKANYALLKELNIKCRGKLHLVFQSMAKCRGFASFYWTNIVID